MLKLNHKYSMAPRLEILSEEQINAIHSASLEILQRIGIKCNNEAALKILSDGGAHVIGDRVWIPPALVEQALRTAPSRSLIVGRNRNSRVLLERNVINYGCGTDVPYHIDANTHEIRSTLLKDIENMNKVVQQCENIDFTSNSGLASDVRPELQDLYHYRASSIYCDKPYFTTAASGENMKAMIEIASIFAGSYENLRSSPSLIVYGEPVSPLAFDRHSIDVLLICAEYGIPIVFPPMVQIGATGPMSVAGGVAQGSAETLAGLVVHQLRNPGAPFIWGPFVSMMDMSTTVCCYGGPVLMKSQVALGQMSRFYNIPTFGFACVTDSAEIDAQCGMEMMWSALVNASAGLNLCHDVGYMNSGLIVSLESLVLADEVISAVSHFMNGIEVNETSLALDVIEKVGPEGNFLSEEHTRLFFKQEGWYPHILNRKRFQPLRSEGNKTMVRKLQDKAQKLLDTDIPPRVSDAEMKEIDKVIKARKRELD
jgi:trimethylamine--corrinoid protein Co-methyltransferase